MQETQVRFLVWEDSTCCRAIKPVLHNYWACVLEARSWNYWAHAPQQWTLPQWEACSWQLEGSPCSLPPERSLSSHEDPEELKVERKKKKGKPKNPTHPDASHDPRAQSSSLLSPTSLLTWRGNQRFPDIWEKPLTWKVETETKSNLEETAFGGKET